MHETTIDRAVMGKLAKALAFICGAGNPASIALQAAADTGTDGDVKKARTAFLKLKPGDRKAALAMIQD